MNKKSALKFFLGGDISLYFARNANSIAGAQFSVGANYFFSKNIALEPTLSYSLTKPLSSQRSGAENNFKFSVELRNFYLKLHESVEDEDAKKDCTARNRIAIGGNLDATLDVDDKYVLGINFDANYGHFLAKNFLISASLGLGLENPTNFSLDDFSDRLILPIRQKFYKLYFDYGEILHSSYQTIFCYTLFANFLCWFKS